MRDIVGDNYDLEPIVAYEDEQERRRMRSEQEVRERIAILREALAGVYGKDMPYEEERLSTRIDEDEWFLKNKLEEKVKGGKPYAYLQGSRHGDVGT